jgi:hypothetical protein
MNQFSRYQINDICRKQWKGHSFKELAHRIRVWQLFCSKTVGWKLRKEMLSQSGGRNERWRERESKY